MTYTPVLQDDTLEHQIRLKQHGNSGTQVSCNCRRVLVPQGKYKWARREEDPLAEFNVGVPFETIWAAYAEHLPPEHPDRRK